MNAAIMDRYQALSAEARARAAALEEDRKIRIHVGSATCEHAAGSPQVREEFAKLIAASGRDDILLQRTGCTGRCSREPIVGVFVPGKMPIKYQRVDRETAHQIFIEHVLGGEPVAEKIRDQQLGGPSRQLMLCDGVRCSGIPDGNLYGMVQRALADAGMGEDAVSMVSVNCLGFCSIDRGEGYNHILIRPDNVLYRIRGREDFDRIINEHLRENRVVSDLMVSEEPISQRFYDLYGDVAFFNRQNRIALRNAGVIDPEDIFDYMRYRGFSALAGVLSENDPEDVVARITQSNLRGRGGGGYPTGRKWADARRSAETTRYIICNADEGDPGAFMDRSMLESDPFSVIEGMIIGGFAIGAQQGFFYVRAEYPLAIERIEQGLAQCREQGLLGKNILDSGFDFDIEVRLGAGAFVCGEETALIHSIEGERGQPRIRPPFPAVRGLWGKPTIINNVETFANIPPILVYGSEWFRTFGTEKSGGTKVFALAGKVRHTGLIEVPMGTTLRRVVEEIGGGVPEGHTLKAVQTGGPAGGCIPATLLDTPIDYETLGQLGSIMGSGGMVVLDETDCMVDFAKYFMEFCQDESCGKCTPCREGTKRMLEILERLTEGKGEPEDLDRLERLALLVKRSSLCGLGRAAPNPVLSTLKHYREEYEAHVHARQCPAKKCVALIHYEIDAEACVGCTMCARNCPVTCISGTRKEVHIIDQAQCIKCGKCFDICRFDAVQKL